jgi:hypothetical protein
MQLTEFLWKYYVRPNKLLFDAPLLFMSNNRNKIRMCIDYRALNWVTIKNDYSLLKVDD